MAMAANELRRMAAEQGLPGGSSPPTGLSSAEAARRLAEFGPNQIPETHERPLTRALRHFWAPAPWMLEVPGSRPGEADVLSNAWRIRNWS
jgi:magnesium-transporting ATPase (P-type)